jgi:hypothetical protein
MQADRTHSALDFSANNVRGLVSNSHWNYLFLFLIWPFLAFVMAVMDYGNKISRRVVYFYLIYYGLTFVIATEWLDSAVYAEGLKDSATMNLSDFFSSLFGLHSQTRVDFVEPMISFLVSRITTFHGILFAAYAAVFGFFYLKSINLLYDQYVENRNLNALIFLLFFISILPIFNINGFRMWTATWIFFFASYHVVILKNRKFLWLAFASPLVHFSFLPASLILALYVVLGNRNAIYLPLLVLSFILPSFLGSIFESAAGLLGAGIQARYSGYSSFETISSAAAYREELDWFMQIGFRLIFTYMVVAVMVARLLWVKTERQETEQNLFSFMLLFLSYANFGMSIPTFGTRFRTVFLLFAGLYLFYFFVKNFYRRINLLTWIGLFPIALYMAIGFRTGSLSVSVWLFSPGLGIPLLAPDFTLYDLLFA